MKGHGHAKSQQDVWSFKVTCKQHLLESDSEDDLFGIMGVNIFENENMRSDLGNYFCIQK